MRQLTISIAVVLGLLHGAPAAAAEVTYILHTPGVV